MLVRSPRQRSSVASSPRPGAPGPRGARGTAWQTPGSPCTWSRARPRRPWAPGRASVPARRPRSAAPRGDTRRRPRRRLLQEPLLRLGQVYSTPSSRWRILPGESAANWAAARGTGNPSQGWGQPRTLFCQDRLGKSPGAARAATPRRRAWQPSPVRGPCAGLPAEGGVCGSRAARRGPPSLPTAQKSQPRRSEGRWRAVGTPPQTLVCKAQPRRARGARNGSASSRPAGRRRPLLASRAPPPTPPPGGRSPGTGTAGSPPQSPPGGRPGLGDPAGRRGRPGSPRLR